ncbi:MAG TPA: tetratricopeptide repeat protein, partial [Terracidiphilus sp.]|nr:tetratricopeptide repeat protein [Terracidiphilus sp.]
ADQGNALAQSILGHLYSDGEGVPQDFTQAVFWYRKAAEQGDDFAQFHLGYLYDKGRSVPQDYAEAYFWLDLAAAGTSGEIAAGERDEVASHMTPADLSREQERARKWFEAHQAKP